MAEALRCPICASADTRFLARTRDVEYFATLDEYDYVCCERCGTVFLRDPPVDQLERIYPPTYYSSDREERGGLLARVKDALDRAFFRELLSELPGDELRVIDIGGGTGWIASAVRRSDPRVHETVVVDLNEGMREVAEARGHRFVCSTIEAVDLDQTFDVVMLLNLIEHVRDPRAVLRRLLGLLAPEGVLVIKTPNTRTLDRRLFEGTYWGGYHAPRHWILFNRENFTSLALECGYRVRSLRFTQGAPQWAASVMALLLRRGWVKLSHQRPMVHHPLFALCMVIFAGLDLLRAPFSQTAQMFVVLEKAD